MLRIYVLKGLVKRSQKTDKGVIIKTIRLETGFMLSLMLSKDALVVKVPGKYFKLVILFHIHDDCNFSGISS